MQTSRMCQAAVAVVERGYSNVNLLSVDNHVYNELTVSLDAVPQNHLNIIIKFGT